MCFLVVTKNEENPIKNGGNRVVTTLFIDFSDAQEQLTPKSVMESCLNSKYFMVGLLTCNNDEYPPKIEATRVLTAFLTL